jgi:ubiquinone/menaquinone biosynthesis C-methylase UbiE
MAGNSSTVSKTNESWDVYWQGARTNNALKGSEINHPDVSWFWNTFFAQINQDYVNPRIVDIASGNGAVVESALAVFSDKQSEITALDTSAVAIENIHSRFPSVKGIVADACTMPFDIGSFDIVTSQFGLEYAGQEAIFEAARILAKGGQLALLLHTDTGSIYQECQQNAVVIKRLTDCEFFSLVTQMFAAGFKAVGAGVESVERSTYANAIKQMAPAIREIEAVIQEYGHRVASDTIYRLYTDVREMHQKIQHYEPDEVIKWLKNMETEIDAYGSRMASMLLSSVNIAGFKKIQSDLTGLGFSVEVAKPFLLPDTELPLAWILVAKKNGGIVTL